MNFRRLISSWNLHVVDRTSSLMKKCNAFSSTPGGSGPSAPCARLRIRRSWGSSPSPGCASLKCLRYASRTSRRRAWSSPRPSFVSGVWSPFIPPRGRPSIAICAYGRADLDHAFISRRGTKLSYPTVAETFHALLEAAGIGGHTNTHRPRLHDFRHRFAVKALEACPDSREHVARHMLALSTYLGHTRLKVRTGTWRQPHS